MDGVVLQHDRLAPMASTPRPACRSCEFRSKSPVPTKRLVAAIRLANKPNLRFS